MSKLQITQLPNLADKKVLIRVDFNVPMDNALNITDDKRIRAAIPSIKHVLDQRGKLILMSHLGRPKGQVVESMRLKPVAERLSHILGQPVNAVNDCIGPEIEAAVDQMNSGDIILLENLRFYSEETDNNPEFSKSLAKLADFYINDAFGAAHRAHASTAGVAKYLPSAAGYLLTKEIKYLGDVLENPAHPFVVILGGSKVSDKINVIRNIIDKVDTIIVGGGMAYTFLKCLGNGIGTSIFEDDKLDLARDILDEAEKKKVKFLLPIDHVIADRFDNNSQITVTSDQSIKDGWMGLDVGPKTVQLYAEEISKAKTVIWNGPVGVFEMENFKKGSYEIAKELAESDATSIIGGGDTAAAIALFGLETKMTHISTGGGASLEYMEGKILPGIDALTNQNELIPEGK